MNASEDVVVAVVVVVAAAAAPGVVDGCHGRWTSRMRGELASGRPRAICDQSSPHCRKLLDSCPPACFFRMDPSRASCSEWSPACIWK